MIRSTRAPAVRELGYAELSAAQSVTGTTVVDVTDLSIAFTSPPQPYWVEVRLEIKNDVTVDTNVTVYITDGSNNILKQSTVNLDNVATDRPGLDVKVRVSEAAGSAKTYKARVGTNQASGDIEIVNGGADELESYITAYLA